MSDAIFILASVIVIACLGRLFRKAFTPREPVKYERQHETYTVDFVIGVSAEFVAKDEAGRLAALGCYLLNSPRRQVPPC